MQRKGFGANPMMGGQDFGRGQAGVHGLIQGYGALEGDSFPAKPSIGNSNQRTSASSNINKPVTQAKPVTKPVQRAAQPPPMASPKKPVIPTASIAAPKSTVNSRKNAPGDFRSPQPTTISKMADLYGNPVAAGSAMRANAFMGTSPAQAQLTGPKASFSVNGLKKFINELVPHLKSGDINTQEILASSAVLNKQGIKLFDFTSGRTGNELVSDESLNSEHSNLVKATQLYQNPSLSFNISPANLRQGKVGDCYILGTLSVMAISPGNIKRLLEDKGDSAVVWLCDSGAWKLFSIKKVFPAAGGCPVYASSLDNCIWQMVIEKAFACMYRGYDRLELGHSSSAMRELTGCGTEYIELENPQEAWAKIRSFLGQGFIMTASSKVSGVASNYITPKHCYGVLDAREVTVQGKPARYLKLMNPIAHNSAKPQVPGALPAISANDLGAFWYPFQLVTKDFEVITCGKINPDMVYSWHTVKGEQTGTGLFMAKGAKGDRVTFSFNHKSLRHYMQQNLETIMKTKYGVARMIVFRLQPEFEILGFGFHALQNVRVEVTLDDAQPVYVFLDIDYDQDFLDEYTLSAMGSSPVVLQREPNAEKFLAQGTNKLNFIKFLLFQAAIFGSKMQVAKTSPFKLDECVYSSKAQGQLKGMRRYYGQVLGYVSFVYINETSNTTCQETLLPVELQNVKEYWPKSLKGGNFCFVLGPDSAEVIVLKFGSQNNCSHVSRIQNKYVLQSS